MSKKEKDGQHEIAFRLDQPLPDWMIFWRRMLQLAHHPHPEKYAPYALNYLLVSTLCEDIPRSPLIEFDPRDYHRFRFKSQTTFVDAMTKDLGLESDAVVVNDFEHASNLLNLDEAFSKERSQLRAELVPQGEAPNFSMLTQFWVRRKSSQGVLKALDIDLKIFRKIRVCIQTSINSVDALFEDKAFNKFLGLNSKTPCYLNIFPKAISALLSGLSNVNDVQALSLIRHHAEEATKYSMDPAAFTKHIHLIFEEIKVLLADNPYELDDFQQALQKFFPGASTFYTQSGSNALSTIVYALYRQKNAQLNVLNIGSKYYEEPIALQHTGHTIIASDTSYLDNLCKTLVEEGKSIDLLRIDTRAPANCQRNYEVFDVLEMIENLNEYNLCSEHFTVVVDGTLNPIDDEEIKKLIDGLDDKINFVYFSSGVKTHCMGIDVATFGWTVAYNDKSRFETFNEYLQTRSEHNAKNNPDFQFVTHLYTHCQKSMIKYEHQLFEQTETIYRALDGVVDIASRENNKVPYLEFFGQTDIERIKEKLSNSLLHYRGSFGFPYPTCLEIHSNNETAIRVACGLLTEEQTTEFVNLLKSVFAIGIRNTY